MKSEYQSISHAFKPIYSNNILVLLLQVLYYLQWFPFLVNTPEAIPELISIIMGQIFATLELPINGNIIVGAFFGVWAPFAQQKFCEIHPCVCVYQ